MLRVNVAQRNCFWRAELGKMRRTSKEVHALRPRLRRNFIKEYTENIILIGVAKGLYALDVAVACEEPNR